MFSQRTGFLMVGAIALLSGCSEGASDSSGTPAVTTAITTADSTIAESTTTTTLATSTTAARTSVQLREGGLGFFNFGDQPQAVIDAVSSVLGAPISDVTRDYPSLDDRGFYVTDEFYYIESSGRSVCWSVGLCISFGGPDVANQLFTGWSYWDDPTSALSTASGITLGSRLDHLAPAYLATNLSVCDNGIDGIDGVTFLDPNAPVIDVRLRSEGIPLTFDGLIAGSFPLPEELVIIGMSAGHNPNDLASECRNDRSAR